MRTRGGGLTLLSPMTTRPAMLRGFEFARPVLLVCVVFVAIGILGRSEFFLGTTFAALRAPLVLVTLALAARSLRKKESVPAMLALLAALATAGDWTADRL